MRKGWEIKTLNQISVNLDSKRIPITKSIRSKGTIPYYGASGIVDYVSEYIFNENLLCISEDGANLLARTYPIAFSISGKTWVNNHAHVIRFDNIITQKFVEFYLNSISLVDFVSGMAQPKLNQTMLNRIPIPLPPLSEQQQIVSILDDAFESIVHAKSNAEQNLKNAKELLESYIQKLITNITKPKIVSLVDACSKITQGPNPKYDNLGEDNYRVLKTKDLYDKVIHYEKADKISKTVFESCKSSELKDGDVLIAIVGQGSINKCNVFENKSNKRYLFTRALGLIRTNQQILLPHFVKIFLQTQQGKNIIDSGINGTSGQQVVTTTHLKSIQIPLPTIEEQFKLINKIDSFQLEIDKLESIYRQKINDLEELKKSILQKAFNGELKTSKISV